jgi:hypothetical protein
MLLLYLALIPDLRTGASWQPYRSVAKCWTRLQSIQDSEISTLTNQLFNDWLGSSPITTFGTLP